MRLPIVQAVSILHDVALQIALHSFCHHLTDNYLLKFEIMTFTLYYNNFIEK